MSFTKEPAPLSVKKILLATDFTAASEKAASYAKALARRFNSMVELAHVFDPSDVATRDQALGGLAVEERRQVSNEALERVLCEFLSLGIEARTVPIEGNRIASELLRIARYVDLVVAGTESKRGLERLSERSIAEQLIRNAKCPVLTLGPHSSPVAEGPLAFQNIVYATDFTPEAAKAATYALSFAQDSGARLYLCYVRSGEIQSSTGQSPADGVFESSLKRLIPESSYDWYPECVVEHGDAAKGILELAERKEADLIVLGARKAEFWFTHIEGGVTFELLAQAACPVMTVC
jgi:nucleotide-binding universal stress UspA family protein